MTAKSTATDHTARVVDKDQLKLILAMGFGELIPIKKWDARDKDRFLGKAPRDNRWVTQRYERAEILDWIKEGGNVGVRLRPTELVIDVDPKHPDADGRTAEMLVDELELELGIDLSECPVVQTGSGGWHVYLRKEAEVRVRNSTELFKGAIEFKSYGRQVLAPGSRHPNGDHYRWLRNQSGPVPQCPAPLLVMIAKPELPKRQRIAGEEISAEQLEQCLGYLDPTDFQHYEKWRDLRFAAHSASGGNLEARDVFVKWSTSDPKYAGVAESIVDFWDDDDVDGDVTEWSLYYHVRKAAEVAGKELPAWLRAKFIWRDFPDDVEQPSGEEPRTAPPVLYERRGGKIAHTVAENVVSACRDLGISIRRDTFAERSYVNDPNGVLRRHFGVADGSELKDETIEQIGLAITREIRRWTGDPAYRTIARAFEAITIDFHPVRDYLDGLKWDGTPRLDRWLVTYGGADDNEYVRAVGALPLIAAVRRVRQPGAKFDELLVLEAPQGKNKSSAIEALCPQKAWFSDDLPIGSDSREVIERTLGKWLIEAGELAGMAKREIERVKGFLSRSVDRARGAYHRLTGERRRHWVAIGTTNDSNYLRDPTGNRRFWPVRVNEFDLDALQRDRDQLWAEAAHREAAGESIRLRRELWAAAGAEQEARRTRDAWEDILREKLGAADDPDRWDGKIAAEDVWYLVGKEDPGRRGQDDNRRLGSAMMRSLGFTGDCRFRVRGSRVTGYARFPQGVTRAEDLERIHVERARVPSSATVRYQTEAERAED